MQFSTLACTYEYYTLSNIKFAGICICLIVFCSNMYNTTMKWISSYFISSKLQIIYDYLVLTAIIFYYSNDLRSLIKQQKKILFLLKIIIYISIIFISINCIFFLVRNFISIINYILIMLFIIFIPFSFISSSFSDSSSISSFLMFFSLISSFWMFKM